MKNLVIILLVIFLYNCSQQNEPKVKYENSDSPKAVSSIKKQIAFLPVLIDSTDYLIHPVGEIEPRTSRAYSSEYYNDNSYSSMSYSRTLLQGNFSNLHFENLKTHKFSSLTDKSIKIISANFLQSIHDKDGQEIIIYKTVDEDTNGNGELNANDVEGLYVSKSDGSKFTKLTLNHHELIDYKVIPENNRIYFRTIEDSNKDGRFNQKDDFHNFFVDLNLDKWMAKPYNLIE